MSFWPALDAQIGSILDSAFTLTGLKKGKLGEKVTDENTFHCFSEVGRELP